MSQIKEKVVVVTGAAGGMGCAIVRMLADQGARLALADLDAKGLGKIGRQAQDSGVDTLTGVVDVTDEGQVQAFMAQVKQTCGRADVLINLPGLSKVAGCHPEFL